jgi:metal-sulfur cluster biosynthetic enzyme
VSADLDRRIELALGQVYDPCSLAANAPVSIVDLGLVLGWALDDRANLTVRLCVTSPCCTLAPNIARGVEHALRELPGIATIGVDLDGSVVWTPARMTRRGQATLRRRRQRSRAAVPLRPRQWREAAVTEPGAPAP